MNENLNYKDFPKLESPFIRKEINEKYIVTPELNPEFEWIFNPSEVIATEKFDGTNVSIIVEKGTVKLVLNRANEINIWKSGKWFYEGIKRAIDEEKFNLKTASNGQYFGELIGERINANPYQVKGHLWLPLDYIKEHYQFKFYIKWLEETKTQDNFERINSLFKELKSLWFRKMKLEKPPEGIVFYNSKTNAMCKMRGDMFPWFQGNKHNWNKDN